jgi:hypothetical protein
MPRPQDVNPHNFHVDEVLYDDGDFSIVWGTWEAHMRCLAMRWNGKDDDAGYPKTFGNPVWFVLPPTLSKPITAAILGVPGTNPTAVIAALRALHM